MDAFARAAEEAAVLALMRAGNFRSAEARLKTLMSGDGEDARAMALLARCRMQVDDDKEALTLARSAATVDPDDWLVRDTLVRALLANKKFAEAEDVAKDLAADDPKDSGALFQLAIARMGASDKRDGFGDMVNARELIDAAEANAEDVWDLITMAKWRVGEWRWADAEALARRAMTIDPTHAAIFQVLAECALAQKKPAEAFDLALEALRLEPGDRATMRLLVRAKARRNVLLKPFLPCVDWIVEMDRAGLVAIPLLGVPVGIALALSVLYDLGQAAKGEPPAVIFSVALGVVMLIGGVSYAVAMAARMGIRRDLKTVALPRF